MVKANVENPTNPGLRMSVPLDLSVYGISWKDLDLNNQPILDLIELESKMVAIYVRMRRSGFGGTPSIKMEVTFDYRHNNIRYFSSKTV
jgi:hypothetical protein